MVLSSTALDTSCRFKPMELHTNCAIDMKGTNADIEATAVPGIVTLNHVGQEMTNASCNQAKDVIIYNGECTDMFAESFTSALKW